MTAKLMKLMPRHDYYVEVFGGGASLLFAKPPVKVETYNDLDGSLVEFFRVLRDPQDYERFQRLVEATPYSRAEYYYCRDHWQDSDDRVERVRRWYVAARQSFSGIWGRSWGFVLEASYRGMSGTTSGWLSTIDRLPEIHARLMRVQIECNDWRKVLAIYNTP